MYHQHRRLHISSFFKYMSFKHLLSAVISKAGVINCSAITIFYDASGYIHRARGPAIVWQKGVRAYYWHGFPHRIGKPWKSDGEAYACYGLPHRLDGPAHGKKGYYIGGVPVKKAALKALQPTGSFEVESRRGAPLLINLKDGVVHCQDEAAIEWLDQSEASVFAIEGSSMTFENYLKDARVLDLDKAFLKLKYS